MPRLTYKGAYKNRAKVGVGPWLDESQTARGLLSASTNSIDLVGTGLPSLGESLLFDVHEINEQSDFQFTNRELRKQRALYTRQLIFCTPTKSNLC